MVVALLVTLNVTLIVLTVAIVRYSHRLDSATRELELTLKAVREEILPLSEETRRVLRHTNELVIGTREQVDRVGRVMESVENLLEGRTITSAAERAVSISRTTLVSVLQGIKEGLKALRSTRSQVKEDSDVE